MDLFFLFFFLISLFLQLFLGVVGRNELSCLAPQSSLLLGLDFVFAFKLVLDFSNGTLFSLNVALFFELFFSLLLPNLLLQRLSVLVLVVISC